MASSTSSSLPQYDYILDKPSRRLQLVRDLSDDGGIAVFRVVDSFLSSVVEAYEMVGEMTSSDKQQVSMLLASIKEKSVLCNREMIGGFFDGTKWKCTATLVMDSLIKTVEEARRAQMLRQLQLCEHNLSGLLKCGFIEIIVTEYKRLLLNTARLLEYVYKYMSLGTLKGQNVLNSLLLCASQLQKLFPLLLRALEAAGSSSELCEEVKNYIVERMKLCFLRIKKMIAGGVPEGPDEYDDLGGGLFITHMDQVLTYLAVFDSVDKQTALSDQWRISVEAVLQHAMSIAQIASQFDFKMIHASGEKILRECKNLEQEYNSESRNPSICKLHAATLSNALEELEQRVCASVLKMYLQVFSDPFTPLDALCERCWSKQIQGDLRKADDLSESIFNFDSHTDRILQVALFAIACSEDQNRISGIRSCLASLESLEAHLVPALTTLYLKQASAQHVFAGLLIEHWNSEVKLLWQLIDGIVDPAALAQVAHDIIWPPTAILKKSILTEKALERSELMKIVKSVVSNAEVLSNQLQMCAEELHITQNSDSSQALKDLLLAVREGKAVLQKIEGSDFSLSVDRILKRCELVVTCVKHIQPLLEELDNPDLKSAQSLTLPCVPQKESTSDVIVPTKDQNLQNRLLKIGLPPDADIEIDTTDNTVHQDFMQTFMDKTVAQPRFMTSFLYNEKPSTSLEVTCFTPRTSTASRAFSRRAAEAPDHLLQQTFSLNVPRLASLSETLRCQSNAGAKPVSHPKLGGFPIESEEDDISNNITTPERIKDLQLVQNKIDAVKISSDYYDQSLFSRPVS